MASFHVQRVNEEADPPRFEWLSTEPSFDDETDEVVGLVWTPNLASAADLGAERAAHWAQLIDLSSFVRFGDAPAEENRDFREEERARAQKAREEHGAKVREEKRKAAEEPGGVELDGGSEAGLDAPARDMGHARDRRDR